MKSNINLVLQKKENKKKMELPIYFVAIFGLSLVAAVALIVLQFVFKAQYNSLIEEEKQLTAQIQEQSEKRIKYLVVKDRLSAIQNVLTNRENVNVRLNSVLSILPEELSINRIDVQEKKMVLSLTSANLEVLNTVTASILPEFGRKPENGVSTIELNSFVSGGAFGEYSASVNIQYAQ